MAETEHKQLPPPTVRVDDQAEYVTLTVTVPMRVWSELSDLVGVRYKDMGEPVREGLRKVLQENAALLLANKIKVGSWLLARAMAD
jgi:hypothetical protein